MRPLLFVLGLAFAATVLVANVGALHCYAHDTDEKNSDWMDIICKDGYNYCSTASGTDGRVFRTCRNSKLCTKHYEGITVTCCSGDFCNGDADHTPLSVDVNPTSNKPDDPHTVDVKTTPSKSHPDDSPGAAMASTPSVPLLIAIFTGIIAAVGI